MPVSTPLRQPASGLLHHSPCAGQKENYPPAQQMSISAGLSPNPPTPTETPASKATEKVVCAQTPTKITARSQWGYEVKNTFIHYGSPLKTVSVVTPPKTVPCDFRPEVLFFEHPARGLRTPAAVYHAAATPSTAGGALTGRADYGCGPTANAHSVFLAPPLPAAPVAAPQQSMQASGATMLRLSDFLPSPSCTTAACGGQVQASSQALTGVSCTWQQPCAYVDTMPVVPPLPGPPCQAPSGTSPMVAQAHLPPPPPPPQFHAFDAMAGMQSNMQQVATASYDPFHFLAGDSASAMSTTTMASSGMQMPPMLPQLPPQCLPPQQPPMLPMEQCQTFQMSSQCGVSPMGGASSSGGGMFCMQPTMTYASPMHMGSTTPMGGIVSCGSVVAEGCLGGFGMPVPSSGPTISNGATASGAMTFSISAAHFPEPGSAQGLQSDAQASPRYQNLSGEGGAIDMVWSNVM